MRSHGDASASGISKSPPMPPVDSLMPKRPVSAMRPLSRKMRLASWKVKRKRSVIVIGARSPSSAAWTDRRWSCSVRRVGAEAARIVDELDEEVLVGPRHQLDRT